MLVSHNKTKLLKGFHEVSGHMLLLGLTGFENKTVSYFQPLQTAKYCQNKELL